MHMKNILFFLCLFVFSSLKVQELSDVSCSHIDEAAKFKVGNPSLWLEKIISKSNDCNLKLRNTQGYEIVSFEIKTFMGDLSQSNVCTGNIFTEGAIAAMFANSVTAIEIDNLRVKNFGGTIVNIKGGKITK